MELVAGPTHVLQNKLGNLFGSSGLWIESWAWKQRWGKGLKKGWDAYRFGEEAPGPYTSQSTEERTLEKRNLLSEFAIHLSNHKDRLGAFHTSWRHLWIPFLDVYLCACVPVCLCACVDYSLTTATDALAHVCVPLRSPSRATSLTTTTSTGTTVWQRYVYL